MDNFVSTDENRNEFADDMGRKVLIKNIVLLISYCLQ